MGPDLTTRDKELILHLKAQTDLWLYSRTDVALNFELTTKASEVADKLALLEAQLTALINNTRFKKRNYLKELLLFDYRGGQDYLGTCVKAFQSSVRDLLAKHGLQLKTTIQPLEDQIREDLPESLKEHLKTLDDKKSSYHTFSDLYKKVYDDEIRWPMNLGGNLITPTKIPTAAAILFPIGLLFKFRKGYFFTHRGCADKAPLFLMEWEKRVAAILLAHLRKAFGGLG